MSQDKPVARVLIVDDEAENVAFVQRALRPEFEVVGETSAKAALARLETSTFLVVIADQRMPEMPGTEFLEQVLLRQPASRRVMLSAFTETESLLVAINRCRVHRFLSKPIGAEELLACVRALTSDSPTNPGRCLVVDEDLARGAHIAESMRHVENDAMSVELAAGIDAFAGHAFVLLSEPSRIDLVHAAVKHCGGAERHAVVMVVLPEGAVHDAAQFLRAGVEDVIWPPVRADEVVARYRTWQARRSAEAEVDRLRGELLARQGRFQFLGQSAPMKDVFQAINRVSKTDATVLLCGETGTGKELAARALHAASHRHAAPFVAVNLSAVPDTLVETELFGHEAGAFTGAQRTRRGRLEAVEGGTLFLDEVGDLSLPVQTKLLRVLQERRFERVGATVSRAANFRLVCATHRDLQREVREGRFREDLFYRVNVVRIDLPPLRDRQDDIPLLADAFLRHFSQQAGKKDLTFSDATLCALAAYEWPGNVRELEHAIERAVALADDGDALQPNAVFERGVQRSFRRLTDDFLKEGRGLDELLHDVERTVLMETMQRYEGNQSEVARKLGLARTTLRSRLDKHDL